jgi:hypothetical protein
VAEVAHFDGDGAQRIVRAAVCALEHTCLRWSVGLPPMGRLCPDSRTVASSDESPRRRRWRPQGHSGSTSADLPRLHLGGRPHAPGAWPAGVAFEAGPGPFKGLGGAVLGDAKRGRCGLRRSQATAASHTRGWRSSSKEVRRVSDGTKECCCTRATRYAWRRWGVERRECSSCCLFEPLRTAVVRGCRAHRHPNGCPGVSVGRDGRLQQPAPPAARPATLASPGVRRSARSRWASSRGQVRASRRLETRRGR